MSKHIQLSIAEPCHENWDKMTPLDKGRFCDSCQKQVVDFSNMSDRQVAEFFKRPSTGSLCGRFMPDQLERDIEIPRKRIPWLKYFFQFAIPAFLMSMKATAQGKVVVTETTNPVQKPTCTAMMGTMAAPVYKKKVVGDTMIVVKPPKAEILPDLQAMGGVSVNTVKVKPVKAPVMASIPVNGKVVDEKGEPIPGATVRVVNTKTSLATDARGSFSLETELSDKLIRLEVSSIGYKTEVYDYPYSFGYTSAVAITIVLTPQAMDLKEVVVTTMDTRRIVGKYLGYTVVKSDSVTTALKKDSSTVKETVPPVIVNKIWVYPNPVSAGSQLNISFKEPEEGYYEVQLLDQQGQLIKKEEIWISSEAGTAKITIPAVAAGNYFLVLTNKRSGKRSTEKIIII